MPMSCSLKVQAESSCTERNPIGRRTQPDRTPNAIRSDGGRNRSLSLDFYIRKWKIKIQKTPMCAR